MRIRNLLAAEHQLEPPLLRRDREALTLVGCDLYCRDSGVEKPSVSGALRCRADGEDALVLHKQVGHLQLLGVVPHDHEVTFATLLLSDEVGRIIEAYLRLPICETWKGRPLKLLTKDEPPDGTS